MVIYRHRANDVKAPLLYLALEIDVQMIQGELFLAHDPQHPEGRFIDFLRNCTADTKLAINVKQSGLCGALESLMKRTVVKDYFYFDMSVADLIEYTQKCPEHTAFRLSEYETFIHQECAWVWIDFFHDSKVIQEDKIREYIKLMPEKKCVVVSPELHGHVFKYSAFSPYGLCADD